MDSTLGVVSAICASCIVRSRFAPERASRSSVWAVPVVIGPTNVEKSILLLGAILRSCPGVAHHAGEAPEAAVSKAPRCRDPQAIFHSTGNARRPVAGGSASQSPMLGELPPCRYLGWREKPEEGARATRKKLASLKGRSFFPTNRRRSDGPQSSKPNYLQTQITTWGKCTLLATPQGTENKGTR